MLFLCCYIGFPGFQVRWVKSMEERRKTIIDRPTLIRIGIILSWAGAFIYLLVSNKFNCYLSPKYYYLPVLSVLIFFGMVWALWSNRKVSIPVDDNNCPAISYNRENLLVWDPLNRMALLLVPLVFLVVIGPQYFRGKSLSGTGRAMNMAASMITGESEVDFEKIESAQDDGKYIEIDAKDIYYNMGAGRINKSVKVIGIAASDPGFPEGMFAVARLLIVCCAACASPVPVFVKGELPKTIPDGEWCEVRGILRIKKYKGKTIYYVEPEGIKLISQPDSPYLY